MALISSIALTGVSTFIGSGVAVAATCPNESPPRSVAATATTPAYKVMRGCIVSFDGTAIVYNLFEPVDASPSNPVYTLLGGPGWGGGGGYVDDCPISGWGLGEDPLPVVAANYAFLNWDPRGFGESGGVSQVNHPQAEGRDVSALIDQVLTDRPEIAVEQDESDPTYGQPAVGMMGGSYGGGIQLAVAGQNPRIKAIVPAWAWNDLNYSLWPGGVPKQTWFQFLFAQGLAVSGISHYASQESCDHVAGPQPTIMYDPNLYRAWAQVTTAGYPDAQTLAWFRERSMSSFGADGNVPRIPTLLIQGTTDTLFNLNDAWANYEMIKSAGPDVPVKMIGFCGGHAGCQYASTPPSGFQAKVPNSVFIREQTLNWFDVYLRHDPDAVDELPDVLLQDQTGVWNALSSFPTAAEPGPAEFVSTPVSGTVVSHGVPTDANNPFTLEQYAAPSNGADPGALTVPLLTAPANGDGVFIAGEPHVDLDVTVQGSSAELFFKLVDKGLNGPCSPQPCFQGARAVVDGQTASVRLDNLDLANNADDPNLPPQTVHVSIDMVGVGYKLPPGRTLELQISSASAPSASNRGAAVTTVEGSVSLPIVQAAVVKDQPAIALSGPSSGTVDQEVRFAAALTKENGDPLSGKPVDFVLGDTDLGTVTTDADGVAAISTVLAGPARETFLTASFAGDETELPTSATVPFTINKAETVTTVAAARSRGMTTAIATLRVREPSRPLAGMTIEFSLNGSVVGSAVTDENGAARFDFGRQPKPHDDVTATYPGDESYDGSSANARVPPH